MHLFPIFYTLASFWGAAIAVHRTTPPRGAVVVRAGTTRAREFSTIQAAVNSLPDDTSVQTIFIFPGTYSEQVFINRTAPLTIFGYTRSTMDFAANEVVIQAGVNAQEVDGSNDASGSLRNHKNDFKMYNVNVTNTFGPGIQAIAFSQTSNRVGLYACSFIGYQDTLLANQGTQVYLRGYIEGAVDFIFGRLGQAFFGGNTIAVKGPGFITANGRESDDIGSYVYDHNKIILAPDAVPGTAGNVFLGRPWGNFSKVIYKNTVVTAPLNPGIWSIWDVGDERTNHVFFAEFNTIGPGVIGANRPNFSTLLNATEARNFSISSAVGSDFATWVDLRYLV